MFENITDRIGALAGGALATLAAATAMAPTTAIAQDPYQDATLPDISYSQTLRQDVKEISSVEDFWNKFTPQNSVYIDSWEVASPEAIQELNTWLRNNENISHHWSVILLGKLDGGEFYNRLSSDLETKAIFKYLHPDGVEEGDGGVVMIARRNDWTPSDPHFEVRTYTGPYFENRGASASGSHFNSHIFPGMKELCLKGDTVGAAKLAISGFEQRVSENHMNETTSKVVWTIVLVGGAVLLIYGLSKIEGGSGGGGGTYFTSFSSGGGGGGFSGGSFGGGSSGGGSF